MCGIFNFFNVIIFQNMDACELSFHPILGNQSSGLTGTRRVALKVRVKMEEVKVVSICLHSDVC
jgi:hypothetical protein